MAALLALSLCCMAADAAVFHEEHIFPLEPMHNHSASLVELPNGDLLAAWFHGRGEKSDDTLVIQGARKPKDGAWSPPFLMADNQDLPDQNPVVFLDDADRLWLFWISSLDNTSGTYMLKYRISTDYLGTGAPAWDWQDVLYCRPKNLLGRYRELAGDVDAKFGERFDSEPKYRQRLEYASEVDDNKLDTRLGWMPRCQPILTQEGRMVLGLYSDIFLTSITASTADGGQTWTFGEPIPGYGGIQPSLVQRRDGTMVAYMRDKSPGKRIRTAESNDGGMTWTPMRELDIANPDSSVSVCALESGAWIMLCNDTTGGPRNGRVRLAVYLSEDEGRTWPVHRVIEDHETDPAASYPTVIQTADGLIHAVYTFTPEPNETIKHIVFNEAWVRSR